MEGKSAAIVGFVASLMPLYDGEQHEGVWCARSLQDGTLVIPVDETEWEEERGTISVRWQGDPSREQFVEGTYFATLAVVRYIELHNLGQPSGRISVELEQLARHFEFKTGCYLYLPYDRSPPSLVEAVATAVPRLGEQAVVNLLLKAAGL